MASALSDHSRTSLSDNHLNCSFGLSKTEECPVNILPESEIQVPSSSPQNDIPDPPPLPKSGNLNRRYKQKSSDCFCVPKEARDLWDKLFEGGYEADVYLITEDKATVPAHFCVLSVASPVLGKYLQDSKPTSGIRYVKIPGVPHGAL
ncbi:BTB/POZ and TAZ domain-containing protein 3 [Bienertia sinuspersici]